jgi:DNA repair protein RadC
MYNPRIPRYRISLVKETSLDVQYPHQVNQPEKAASIFRELFENADREMLAVMTLDSKHKIIGINVVSIGTLNQSLAGIREMLKLAILQNANSIIHGHNHPSGDPVPSAEDRSMHGKLESSGVIMGIKVLDGIICGENSYWSMQSQTEASYASSGV